MMQPEISAVQGAWNPSLSKHSVDPGNADRAFLRLNDNIVALLEAIEVVLIHGDMFKAPPVSPRGNDKAPAARKRACGHFSDDGRGNADGARSVQLAIQKK